MFVESTTIMPATSPLWPWSLDVVILRISCCVRLRDKSLTATVVPASSVLNSKIYVPVASKVITFVLGTIPASESAPRVTLLGSVTV